MSKIMIVEDDASLREIYTIRLNAEGFNVVSAGDGEEALAMAVNERPDLILSDVMMPKISGFDMLDILRQTPETKNLKVIMMTALSSDEQRSRGENLGADKYLVKSQVGIEDVVNAIHEVLGDKPITPSVDNNIPSFSVNQANVLAQSQMSSMNSFNANDSTTQPLAEQAQAPQNENPQNTSESNIPNVATLEQTTQPIVTPQTSEPQQIVSETTVPIPATSEQIAQSATTSQISEPQQVSDMGPDINTQPSNDFTQALNNPAVQNEQSSVDTQAQ